MTIPNNPIAPAQSVKETGMLQRNLVHRWLHMGWDGLRLIFDDYFDKRVARMSAALSYYTMFSLAPLLVIAIATAGLVFGDEAARQQITAQFQRLAGNDGAAVVKAMLDNGQTLTATSFVAVLGVLAVLIGATGVFAELHDSLNAIWEVRTRPGRPIRSLIPTRLWAFAMVFGIGFLLLASLVVSAGLTALGTYARAPDFLWHGAAVVIDAVVSLAILTVLFAIAFKVLPDVSVRWSHVWLGAVVTAALFVAGKSIIGIYLGSSAIASTFGAAGSLAIMMIWIYYSSQIFLVGALFTRAVAVLSGSRLEPNSDAEWVPGNDPEKARGGPALKWAHEVK